MPIKSLLAVIILLMTFSPALAEMYQWIAEDGSVTFKDMPPPVSKKRKKVKVYSDSDFAPVPPPQPESTQRSVKKAAKPAPQPEPPRNDRFSGTVEMYVTEWCGYCKQAKSYMKSRGINYVAYDIEKDSAANKRHKDLGGNGVPLIIIGSNRMSGFSPESLEYYLSNSR